MKDLPQVSIDPSRFFRFQAPMLPERATFQQYVVGRVIDSELWLLHSDHPPQIAPVSDSQNRFQVFVSGEKSDMESLILIWHYTCRLHESPLEIYSLKDLGIEHL